MRFTLLLVAAVFAVSCGRETAPPTRAAPDVNQAVEEIKQEERRSQAAPGEQGRDPIMEEQCAGVSRDQAAALEERMRQERESGAMTVLTGDDTQVLSCSRYWKKLGG